MRCVLYVVIFLISTPFLLHSQEFTDSQYDSIQKQIDYAFNLNHTSEYGKSIKITKQILKKLEGSKRYSLLGYIHDNLSYSYAELKDKDKAFEYAFKARDYYIQAKDTINIIMSYNNIGVTYDDFDMVEKANATYRQALNLGALSNFEGIPLIKYERALSSIYCNIGGNLVLYSKQYKEGIKCLNKSIYYCKKSKYNENETTVYVEDYLYLAYANYKLKRFEESERYFNMALDIGNRNKFLPFLKKFYELKVELFKEDKKFEEALKMMNKYIEIKDSINEFNNLELAKTIEARYKVKESEEKLNFAKKEGKDKEKQLSKSNTYNILLAILSIALLLTIYWIIIKNRQLQLARDRAENLSKVKSDFYSEISHELRTPLYAVIQLSSILLEENVSIAHKEYLESLKFSGNHLLSLINNVLELNKVESGKTRVQKQDFDLKNLITNITESLEYALADSNNSISLEYDNTIPKLLVGDSLKLSQILINLISNAIKFTNNGHIDVVINKVKTLDNEVFIYFRISDNGLGISEEKQKQIFEDFYQEHSKNAKSYKGTGLGLSIVKRTLQAMNSDIKVASKENEGSAFFFELAFELSTKINISNALFEEQLKVIKNKNFLIVDDNKINQLVTRKVLDQLNISSKVVDSGLEAIIAVKQNDFDCILMDLHMPVLDGYETSKGIRKFNKTIPIIALTAAATEEVEDKIKDYNMNGYIFKPFFIVDFVETLSNVITNKK